MIAIVFLLAWLHIYCLGKESMVPDPLLVIDQENIINDDNGYVDMEHSNAHNISIPTALMDVGHHFDDVPRSLSCHPL